MKKRSLKPFKLGTYQLGHQWVDVWLDPSEGGGDFCWTSDKKQNLRMTIGIAAPGRWEPYGTILHEAIEELTDHFRLRFRHSSSFSGASDMYTFILDHNQFTEVCSRAGAFMDTILEDFNKAWAKYHK